MINIHSKKFLLLIAFLSGFTVIALEICASRLLAPYFGTSLLVWTNIIGIVLSALSIGYYVGGKLAERHPNVEWLLRVILVAGITALLIPWLIRPLATIVVPHIAGANSSSISLLASSLFISILLFGVPIMLLGMTSPYLIKIYSLSESKMGDITGSIFAISTIGSMLGTFLPTLWLIPTFGTRKTIAYAASTLILLGICGLKLNVTKLAMVLLWTGALLLPTARTIKPNAHLLSEDESIHQFIQVLEQDDDTRVMAFNEGAGFQSIYKKNQILTGKYYYDFFSVLPKLVKNEGKQQILTIGLAGGTMMREYNYFYKDGVQLDAVEVDDKVIALGKQYFGLNEIPLHTYHQDGRVFINNNQKKYDVIIVDAYQNELYIPWTLTTQEFWNSIKASLTPNGLVAININATRPDSKLLQAIGNTQAKVFNHTYLSQASADKSLNYLMVSSSESLDYAKLPNEITDPALKDIATTLSSQTSKLAYDIHKSVLTDDRAPVELMTDGMILDYLLK